MTQYDIYDSMIHTEPEILPRKAIYSTICILYTDRANRVTTGHGPRNKVGVVSFHVISFVKDTNFQDVRMPCIHKGTENSGDFWLLG